jgi:carboxylesterase type B
MMSDRSKGLFKRAILMSGVAYNSWVFSPRLNFAKRLSLQLGGGNESTEASMLEVFESRQPFELIAASANILTHEEKYGFLIEFVFGPIVEPSWSKNAFIPHHTTRIARSAWAKDIDCIIGVTSFEGLFVAFREQAIDGNDYINAFNQNVGFFAPLLDLGLNETSIDGKRYGQKIKEIYYRGAEMTKNNLLPFYRVRTLQFIKIKEEIKFSS